MLDRLKNWCRKILGHEDDPATHALRTTGAYKAAAPPSQKVPRPNPEFVVVDEELSGEVENEGPGKNVLIRNKFHREETGTHETLKILDDSLVDSGEETGIDPYNTGGFDRSRNWDKRFGK